MGQGFRPVGSGLRLSRRKGSSEFASYRTGPVVNEYKVFWDKLWLEIIPYTESLLRRARLGEASR